MLAPQLVSTRSPAPRIFDASRVWGDDRCTAPFSARSGQADQHGWGRDRQIGDGFVCGPPGEGENFCCQRLDVLRSISILGKALCNRS
jgi:hypothetical protein